MTLKDLPEGWTSPDIEFIKMLRIAMGGVVDAPGPVRVHRGVYEAHFNFDKEIEDLIVEDYPRFDDMSTKYDGDQWFSSFGVVDHWSQLPLKALDADSRNLLVYLGHIRRADQPERGGWRWHKWGPYLGVHSPETSNDFEYLYDAIDVVEVWTYHVVEVR